MRSFVRFIVDNHHFSILLVLIVLAYGLVSVAETPLTKDPSVPVPKVMLELFVDGASPSEMERNAVFPIEQELRTIPGIEGIRTAASHSYAQSWISFTYGVDLAERLREVESAISRIRRKLPSQLDFRARQYKIADWISAFLFSVEGEGIAPAQLRETAQELATRLRKVADLKDVELVTPDEQVEIALDAPALARLGIGLDQVQAAIRADNAFAASGRLHVIDRDFRFAGPASRYRTPEDIGATLLYAADGTPVALREVARVQLALKGTQGITRRDGREVFFVQAHTSESINILDVSRRVTQAVEEFRAGLPEGVRVETLFDQSEGVETIVFNLQDNFLQGIAILFCVLLFTVGMRSSLVISSILPLSFLTAVCLLGFSGYGIQQMTIAGFIVALGLLVDNAIVVTENVFLAQRYQGATAKEAAVEGTVKAFAPLLSSTLTTMLAFVPTFLLTSEVGLYLRSMSVTIWFSLLASLFMSVTVVTLLLSRFGTLGKVRWLPNPPSALNALIPFRDGPYKRLVNVAIRFRWLTIIAFIGLLAFSINQARQLHIEVFPPTGAPYLTVNLTLAPGLDGPTREGIIQELEGLAHSVDGVDSVLSFSGVATPQIDLVMDPRGDIVALVRTRSGVEPVVRRVQSALKAALRPLKAYGEVTVGLFQYHDLTYAAPFSLKVTGSDVAKLAAYVAQIDEPLREVEGVDAMVNPLKGSQTLLDLAFDRERAAQLGVTKAAVDPWINLLTYGIVVDRMRDGRGEERPLLLKVAPREAAPLAVLHDLQVPTLHGGTVPLAEVVEARFRPSESRITHVDFEPTVEIDFWLDEGLTPEQVSAKVMQRLKDLPPPSGVSAEIGGSLVKKRANFKGLGANAVFAALLIFAILVLQFRSFSQPFIVLAAVPMCIIGALLGLVVTDQSMTFVAAVGITSLIGIVVNDTILLVEEGNLLRAEDPSQPIALVAAEAARKRFMPVLLTSITTIAGLLPMAVTDNLFKTMAITISGGLFSSTLLTLLMVPALYSFLSSRQQPVRSDP